MSSAYAGDTAQALSRWDLYSETTYGKSAGLGEDNLVNSAKLSYSFFQYNDLRFYGGVAFDQDLRSDAVTIYNDNHVAPLLGFNVSPEGIPFGFFAEAREALRPSGSRPAARQSSELYAKTGFYGYDFRDFAHIPALGKKSAFFNEAYGEAIFVSKIERSLSSTAKDKLGYRIPVFKNVSADFYGEALIKRSNLDYVAENLQEAGPAIRLNAFFGPLSASASARKGYGTYANGSGNFTGWTGLFVIAGEM